MNVENLSNIDIKVNIASENGENNTKKEQKEMSKKDEFASILEKIQRMDEAIELHNNVKKALSNKEVDQSYLKYIENSIEDKIFCDAKFDKISPKVLIEIVCPKLRKIKNFDISKLEIEDVGNHFEGNDNYIDKICVYDGKLICMFGVQVSNIENVIKYRNRKFVREDILEAVKAKVEPGKTVEMSQYDEYFVIQDENSVKVYSEKKEIALAEIKENAFDKIKSRLTNLFSKINNRKKEIYPIIELVYDSNPNRFKDIEMHSKVDAKNRMKVLLNKERAVTRTNI